MTPHSESLDRAAKFEQEESSYNSFRHDAPELQAQLREEVDGFAQEPTLFDAREMTLHDITVSLAIAESDLATARSRVAKLQEKQTKRSERRGELPEFRSKVQGLLNDIPETSGPDSAASEEPEISRIVAESARRLALKKEVAAYGAEIGTFDFMRKVGSLRTAIAEHALAQAELKVVTLQNLANERRATEARAAARTAAVEQQRIVGTDPELKAIAEWTAIFAGRRTGEAGLSSRIASTKSDLTAITSKLDRLAKRITEIRQRVDAVGFSEAVGLLLRKDRAHLPDPNHHLREIRSRRSELGQVQLELLELEDRRAALQNIGNEIEEHVERRTPFSDSEEEQQFRRDVRDLLESQPRIHRRADRRLRSVFRGAHRPRCARA